VVESENHRVRQKIGKAGDSDRQERTRQIIELTEVFGWGEIETDLFERFTFCGRPGCCISRVNFPTGEGEIAGPRVASVLGATDDQHLQLIAVLA
jgi:hypothetical protein